MKHGEVFLPYSIYVVVPAILLSSRGKPPHPGDYREQRREEKAERGAVKQNREEREVNIKAVSFYSPTNDKTMYSTVCCTVVNTGFKVLVALVLSCV